MLQSSSLTIRPQGIRQSTDDLNSKFFFSWNVCLINAKDNSLPYDLPIAVRRNDGFMPFRGAIWVKWNTNCFIQDLNSGG